MGLRVFSCLPLQDELHRFVARVPNCTMQGDLTDIGGNLVMTEIQNGRSGVPLPHPFSCVVGFQVSLAVKFDNSMFPPISVYFAPDEACDMFFSCSIFKFQIFNNGTPVEIPHLTSQKSQCVLRVNLLALNGET